MLYYPERALNCLPYFSNRDRKSFYEARSARNIRYLHDYRVYLENSPYELYTLTPEQVERWIQSEADGLRQDLTTEMAKFDCLIRCLKAKLPTATLEKYVKEFTQTEPLDLSATIGSASETLLPGAEVIVNGQKHIMIGNSLALSPGKETKK
jgi:hypothetical protein